MSRVSHDPALNSLDMQHTQMPAPTSDRAWSDAAVIQGRGFRAGRQSDAFAVSIRGHGMGRGLGPV
jgi:hypothetical protein